MTLIISPNRLWLQRIWKWLKLDCTTAELNRHTSKPRPDSDLDSDPKKTRTRQKPGLVLGLAFKKPGLDNRKPGLQIENTGFDETGF